MSDNRTRIDTLLNPAATTPVQSGPASGSAPDVTVYVDDQQVTPDANGSTAIEITPSGYSPLSDPNTSGTGAPGPTAPGTSGTPGTSTSGTSDPSASGATDTTGTSGSTPPGTGPAVPGQQPGGQPPGSQPGQQPGSQPPGQQPGTQPPGQQPGTQPPGQQPGTQPPGQQGSGSQPGQPPPATDVTGLGEHAAKVDLTDPSGQQHVPYTVQKNADGSLDITVAKSPDNPHATRIHVAAGKHIKLDLNKDKDGHVTVRADPATQPPAVGGVVTPPGSGDTPPGAGDPPPSGDGNDLPPGVEPPPPADAVGPPPGGGGGPPPGGGGGPPPGGGGGPPPGGGGGPPPGGGGGPPPGGGNGPPPGGSTDPQSKNTDRPAMRKLGDNLVSQPGVKMTEAATKTSQIQVGFPGFGVLGLPLSATHDSVRQSAVKYLVDGHDTIADWKKNLYGNATNWDGADASSSLPPA